MVREIPSLGSAVLVGGHGAEDNVYRADAVSGPAGLGRNLLFREVQGWSPTIPL